MWKGRRLDRMEELRREMEEMRKEIGKLRRIWKRI